MGKIALRNGRMATELGIRNRRIALGMRNPRRPRINEQDADRKNAPCSKSTGEPLCCYYNSRAGCYNNECKHAHGEMEINGIRRGF